MIIYTRSTSDKELHQILNLQQNNLPVSVSEEEQKAEGFVTVQHSFELLKAMHNKCPHTLAKDGDKVVAYALSMHPDFGDRIEVLKPMFFELKSAVDSASETFSLTSDNFIVMGQICVDKAYRKQGIFRKLYDTMRSELIPPFSSIITEVNAKNNRSLAAHYAVGFKELHTYVSGGQEWVLLFCK